MRKKKEKTILWEETQVNDWECVRVWRCKSCHKDGYAEVVNGLHDASIVKEVIVCPECGDVRPGFDVIERSRRSITTITKYSDGTRDYDDKLEYKDEVGGGEIDD